MGGSAPHIMRTQAAVKAPVFSLDAKINGNHKYKKCHERSRRPLILHKMHYFERRCDMTFVLRDLSRFPKLAHQVEIKRILFVNTVAYETCNFWRYALNIAGRAKLRWISRCSKAIAVRIWVVQS